MTRKLSEVRMLNIRKTTQMKNVTKITSKMMISNSYSIESMKQKMSLLNKLSNQHM